MGGIEEVGGIEVSFHIISNFVGCRANSRHAFVKHTISHLSCLQRNNFLFHQIRRRHPPALNFGENQQKTWALTALGPKKVSNGENLGMHAVHGADRGHHGGENGGSWVERRGSIKR